MLGERVAIVGAGYTPLRPISPEVSFREMIFEAAVKAYADAGIRPHDVSTFVSVAEDYNDGTAITDEYVPDQLGAVLKPVQTVSGDGITGLASLVMQLETGQLDLAVIEGHSKASNVVRPAHIQAFALDPIYARPLAFHPNYVAGLEMRAFLAATGNTEAQAALVAALNRASALRNPLAAYPARMTADDVLTSRPEAEPLKRGDIAATADGAIVLVLARESQLARYKLNGRPVFINGIGWGQHTPNIEERDLHRAIYAEQSGRMAYKMAGITNPASQIDFAEVDDTFSYKQLQHLEALGLAETGQAGRLLEQGVFSPGGALPVNVSGGHLGCGYTHEMAGLRSVLEVVLQLRGTAGERQLPGVRVGLAQSWRGIPTTSGAVAVLGRE
ncbi:MAG: acetyl-CoA acetyltransferase [Dehalococcoidia bacterium]|nr:acetyl-CoA acetyltransferase [Dehalococcoidia bacterium]MSQ16286.1 acetyl-CoA acetyltransferase [Dehalococcoidia bacterium]